MCATCDCLDTFSNISCTFLFPAVESSNLGATISPAYGYRLMTSISDTLPKLMAREEVLEPNTYLFSPISRWMTIKIKTFVLKSVVEMNQGPPVGITSLSAEVSIDWDYSENMANSAPVAIICFCSIKVCLMSRACILESFIFISSKVCKNSLFNCSISCSNMSVSTSFSLGFNHHNTSDGIKAFDFLLDVGVAGKEIARSASQSSIWIS